MPSAVKPESLPTRLKPNRARVSSANEWSPQRILRSGTNASWDWPCPSPPRPTDCVALTASGNELGAPETPLAFCHADQVKSRAGIKIEEISSASPLRGYPPTQSPTSCHNDIPRRAFNSERMETPDRERRPLRSGSTTSVESGQRREVRVRRKAIYRLLDRSPPAVSFPSL